MTQAEIPKCPHCQADLKKWTPPDGSTWTSAFQWVCFNDECGYFIRGWDHLMQTQKVKASYRHRLDPDSGNSGPLPCWSADAHKDRIQKD